MQGEEKYRTQGFNEITLIYGVSKLSFRKTANLINRIRYQEKNGTPYRTIRDITNIEGAKIQKSMDEKSKKIFKDNGLNHKIKTKQEACDSFVQMPSEVEDQKLFKVVQCLSVKESLKPQILKNPVPYINPGEGVDICLDDVGVKKQKDERENKPLISYLRKNTPMIPAYSVRKEIGLINSSNRGEKTNDLLVADRQKNHAITDLGGVIF